MGTISRLAEERPASQEELCSILLYLFVYVFIHSFIHSFSQSFSQSVSQSCPNSFALLIADFFCCSVYLQVVLKRMAFSFLKSVHNVICCVLYMSAVLCPSFSLMCRRHSVPLKLPSYCNDITQNISVYEYRSQWTTTFISHHN